MTTEIIQKFVERKDRKNDMIGIHFKERSSVKGIFIRALDYDELKSKNLWRVVNHVHAEEWLKTKNADLTRIFNGVSFTRLTDEE